MSVFHFDRALLRRPAASVIHGLRAVDRGAPTLAGIEREFDAYAAALRDAGLVIDVLDPLDAFPDAVFIEDPALVFPEGAILLRPGAPSRRGEAAALAPELRMRFPRVLEVEEGNVDGGDVMATPGAVLIGLSARTDERGAQALGRRLEELGRRSRIVVTPADVLHFKTDSSLIDDHTVLATERLARSGVFEGFRVVHPAKGEEAAANALRINDRILIGDTFPGTMARLRGEGFRVVPLPVEQIGLLDAGLSCMSLRWAVGGGREGRV